MAVIGNAPFQGLVSGGNIIDASIEGVDLSTSAIAARLGYTPVDPGAAVFSANPTISSGTANAIAYLNGSKVVTTGSALGFDGSTLSINNGVTSASISLIGTYAGSGTVAFLNFQRVGGAVAGTLGYDDSVNSIRFGTTTNHSTVFLQNNAEAMRLSNSGLSVGISSGAGAITVGSNAGRTQYQYITFGGGQGAVDYGWQVGRSASNGIIADGFYIYDIKANTTRLTINSSGQVGVGTTNPQSPLHIYTPTIATDAKVTALRLGSLYGGGDARNAITFWGSTDTDKMSEIVNGWQAAGSYLAIYTRNLLTGAGVNTDAAITEKLRVTAQGNLLLGTTTNTAGFSTIVLSGGPSANNSGIQLGYGASTFGGAAITTANAAGGGLTIWTYTGAVGSETYSRRVDLDSSGRLMVGVTSNINASTVIQAGGLSQARIGIDSPDTQGFYFTKSGANNGTFRVDENGHYEWYTKTVSQAMVLKANGYLGIGQTNPQTILHLSGTNQDIYLDNLGVGNNGLKLRYQTNATHGFNFTYQPNDATCYIDSVYATVSGTVYGDIYFRQNIGSGTMATRMTIKADGGNVLIGTTSKTTNAGWLQIGQVPNSTSSSIGFNNEDNAVISAKYSQVYQVNNTNSVSGRGYEWRIGGKGYADGSGLMSLDSTSLLMNVPVDLNAQRLRDVSGTGRVFYNVTNVNDLYSNGSTTGAIVIDTTIPALTAGTMVFIKICGYSYNSSQPWEMKIGVYSGESNLYSKGYECLSNPFDIVRLARKTTGGVNTLSIILGNGSGVYGTSVYVEKVILNFSNQNTTWATGWSMSRSTTLSGYDNVQTVNGSVNGIPFKPTIPTSGTGSYSTDPNTLDDYEEGTWSPTPSGLSSISYGYREGTYVKVGKIVTVFWDFTVNSSSGSGGQQLYGLPFTVSSSQAGYSVVHHRDASIIAGTPANGQLKGYTERGTSHLVLQIDYSGTNGYSTQGAATYNNSGRHTGYCTYTTSD